MKAKDMKKIKAWALFTKVSDEKFQFDSAHRDRITAKDFGVYAISNYAEIIEVVPCTILLPSPRRAGKKTK